MPAQVEIPFVLKGNFSQKIFEGKGILKPEKRGAFSESEVVHFHKLKSPVSTLKKMREVLRGRHGTPSSRLKRKSLPFLKYE